MIKKEYTYTEKCKLHIEKLAKINKGRKRVHSPETIKKMADAKRGKPSPMKGKPRPFMSGDKHPLWKGGKQLRQKRFGISQQQYDEMLAMQGNVCAICKNPEKTVDKRQNKVKCLSIDHCHNTDKVRGLLCNWCNTGLGQFKDNIDTMMKAIEYLKNFNKMEDYHGEEKSS